MRKQTRQAMLLGALLLASALAHAQYAWIDEKGVRQYSDQPPPTSTPDAKILKSPRGTQPNVPDTAPAPAAPAKAAPTWTDREADYRARQVKKEEDSKKAAAASAQCDVAKRNKAQIESGRPVRSAQNVVMTAADKSRELANIATVLNDCQ